jgi:hypothetical protein
MPAKTFHSLRGGGKWFKIVGVGKETEVRCPCEVIQNRMTKVNTTGSENGTKFPFFLPAELHGFHHEVGNAGLRYSGGWIGCAKGRHITHDN